MSQDDVRAKRDQFRRVSANIGGIGRCPARLDAQVAADVPAPSRLRRAMLSSSASRIVFGREGFVAKLPEPVAQFRFPMAQL